MAVNDAHEHDFGHEQLLRALAEQLKLPLLQISQVVELARLGEAVNLNRIETATDMALELVDAYVLGAQLSAGQLDLRPEPVSVASVLREAADRLERVALEYNCVIGVDLSSCYRPVMVDRRGLTAAITSLGYSFIEAQSRHGAAKARVVLAARHSRQGIVAGAYADQRELAAAMLRRARQAQGRGGQTPPPLGHGSNAGIFVADALLRVMSSGLRAARWRDLTGLAAVLKPSAQLTLV